jgi:hypothetical protein
VPRLRELAAHRKRVARRGADKKGFDGRRMAGPAGHVVARDDASPPDPFGYYHATSSQHGTFYGCQAAIGVYTPVIASGNGDDHSLMQFGLVNHDFPQHPQTLEAGWTVDVGLNGNANPHIFTYFTINGYQKDGHGAGGYNQADGWVQYDRNVYPGIAINGTSVDGGQQLEVSLKYQLWQRNWWFQVQGIWLGYYPASLFDVTGYPPPGLSDHADWAGFWGEVNSTLSDPTKTKDQMGSGQFGEAGWQHACYQHNAQVQIDTLGTMADLNGAASAEDSRYYDIVQTMRSGTNWGSYFFAGGAGAHANNAQRTNPTLVTSSQSE